MKKVPFTKQGNPIDEVEQFWLLGLQNINPFYSNCTVLNFVTDKPQNQACEDNSNE